MRDTITNIILRITLAVLVILAIVAYKYRAQVEFIGQTAAVVLAVALVARVGIMLTRFGLAPAAAKRNYPRMIRCHLRWRWLTRNLGLAYQDPHRKTVHRGAIGAALGSNTRVEYSKGHIRYPRARFRADAYGIVARVRTTPRVGRTEFEKHAQHIADAWGCFRVSVTQPRPGRIIIRGLLTDPLAETFTIEDLATMPAAPVWPGGVA